MSDKRITGNQLLGEQGVALIGLAVAKLGFVWRPTSVHDAGIDGEIEIRDPGTGSMSGLLMKVQSKAVSAFDKDTATSFEYTVDRRDLEYWLEHNVPVILCVSRPASQEIYWQPVREASGLLRPRRFKFDKTKDRLDDSASGKLVEYVRQGTPGARGFAQFKTERLLSNPPASQYLSPR